jgi:predicted ribosomally synthesized peptide with nif11-like leader
MTTRAVAGFFKEAEQNAALAERIAAIPAADKESWAAEIVRLARVAGFSFQARDIDAAVEEQKRISAELGEDDLAQVSGGTQQQQTDYAFLSTQAEAPARYNFYEAWPCKWYVPEL